MTKDDRLMMQHVPLGDNWWTHTGDCTEVQIGPHVHYGENVIVTDPTMVPADVLDALAEHMRDELCLETTDAPGYSTTAVIPRKRADHDHQH